MSDPIRIGVIGAGGIFRHLYVPFFQQTALGRIVAVANARRETAQPTASLFGAAVCDSWQEILSRKDIDAVIVGTHPRPHCEISVAAARAGKHILIEKPLCRTLAEGRQMVAAARDAGVNLQVAYQMPFHPCFAKVRELIAGGDLGQVQMAWHNSVGFFPPKHPWLFVKSESGGMLAEQAVHIFDLWLWLFGPAASVYARTSSVPMGGTYPAPADAVENNAAMIVGFKNGATATLLKSWTAEVQSHTDGIVGSRGSLSLSFDEVRWKTQDMPAAETYRPIVPDDGSYSSLAGDQRPKRYWHVASKGRCIDNWLHSIVGGESLLCPGEVGLAAIELAEAAYRSSASGQVVTLPF